MQIIVQRNASSDRSGAVPALVGTGQKRTIVPATPGPVLAVTLVFLDLLSNFFTSPTEFLYSPRLSMCFSKAFELWEGWNISYPSQVHDSVH